ncbi:MULTISPECIES: DUF2267 domain-containing protein [Streptomyces]|nr:MULTISPECIES: DUF2267 domain-containing protein [unclassified Streptomyces]MBD3006830.1 DUF2267 domain-containing protein [Streptomyces sp. 5-10]
MFQQRRPGPQESGMTYDELIEAVRYDGLYSTRERAEEVTRTVLAALGRQLTGEERVALAAALPRRAARVLAAEIPGSERLTGWGFVKEIAAHTPGSTRATARWDAGSVLGIIGRVAGPELLRRILDQLPEGYALLFGQAELARPPQPA